MDFMNQIYGCKDIVFSVKKIYLTPYQASYVNLTQL